MLRATKRASEGKFADALKTAEEHLKLAEELVGRDDIGYAMALHQKAAFLQMMGRLSEAERLLMDSIYIAEWSSPSSPSPHSSLTWRRPLFSGRIIRCSNYAQAIGAERRGTQHRNFLAAGGVLAAGPA
jgi:hypothetical protein